jgi:hypothetical protein
MEPREGHLEAGAQAVRACGNHHVLDQHAEVEPAVRGQAPVYGEEQADRCTKKPKVFSVCRLRLGMSVTSTPSAV